MPYLTVLVNIFSFFFFSSRRRHTRCYRDWSSDVCSSDLNDDGESVLGLRHVRDARAREVEPGHQRHDGDEHERREGGQTPEMSPLGRLGSAIRWRYQAFAHDREHRAIVQPMPAHATGSGTISFGLVPIPAKLYTAAASQSVSFNLLHAKCGSRIKLQNFCPVDNEVVDRAALVRGYEFAKDQY